MSNSRQSLAKILAIAILASILAFGACGLSGCDENDSSSHSSHSSSTSTSSSSSSSSSSSAQNQDKVKSWSDAKGEAIKAWMVANQTNLDDSNLKYADEGTNAHGYIVHCYIDHKTHTETIFRYSVSKDGKVYDETLCKYVN